MGMSTGVNHLVMNFLLIEGHKEAAACFQKEASVQRTRIDPSLLPFNASPMVVLIAIPPRVPHAAEMDLESITGRMEVRTSLQNGDVITAIDKIKQLHPTVRWMGILT